MPLYKNTKSPLSISPQDQGNKITVYHTEKSNELVVWPHKNLLE